MLLIIYFIINNFDANIISYFRVIFNTDYKKQINLYYSYITINEYFNNKLIIDNAPRKINGREIKIYFLSFFSLFFCLF